jgi:hypothetical protein
LIAQRYEGAMGHIMYSGEKKHVLSACETPDLRRSI